MRLTPGNRDKLLFRLEFIMIIISPAMTVNSYFARVRPPAAANAAHRSIMKSLAYPPICGNIVLGMVYDVTGKVGD